MLMKYTRCACVHVTCVPVVSHNVCMSQNYMYAYEIHCENCIRMLIQYTRCACVHVTCVTVVSHNVCRLIARLCRCVCCHTVYLPAITYYTPMYKITLDVHVVTSYTYTYVYMRMLSHSTRTCHNTLYTYI